MRLPSPDSQTAGPVARLSGAKVQWLGHATFVITSPAGTRMLFDPFVTGNPSCPPACRNIRDVDLILITHGHSDHCEDAARLARDNGATVIASPELTSWLEKQGVKHLRPMNIGGRQHIAGIDICMVPAVHSSSAPDGTYLGPATGFVVAFDKGTRIYFAGDTALFGDMRVIRERLAPAIAFLPIGDRFTMGPEDAAIAAEWLGVKTVVPMHYGTFPELTGTPADFHGFCAPRGIDLLELRPGEIVG